MPAGEIHVGDHTTLRYTVLDQDGNVVDLSAATDITLTLRPRNGTGKSFQMTDSDSQLSFETDGSDGIVLFEAGDGDWDSAGWWYDQLLIELTTGNFYSDVGELEIHANIADL